MREINSVYITDKDGTPIFIREYFIQGSENVNHALFSKFISAFQSFAIEVGGKETDLIELGNSKIFSFKDEKSNLRFLLKCSKEAKSNNMNQILNEITNKYIKVFTESLKSSEEEKEEMMIFFKEDLDELLGYRVKIQSLLE